MTGTAAALLALAVVVAAAPGWAQSSTELHDYRLACAGCHGAEGRGSTDVPALSAVAQLAADEQGRRYLTRIPGIANAPLNDARLARLLDWVVQRFGDKIDVSPFSEKEIAQGRSAPLLAPLASRPQLAAHTSARE